MHKLTLNFTELTQLQEYMGAPASISKVYTADNPTCCSVNLTAAALR